MSIKTDWFSSHVFQSFLRISYEKPEVFLEKWDFSSPFRGVLDRKRVLF